MGKKSVIIFIHGGPGLSSSYLKGWFDYLKPSYDLFFYDQDFSKLAFGKAISTLSDELTEKINILAQKYNEIVVFAHSWGTFLFISSIGKIREYKAWSKIKKVILSNPADLDWMHYQDSGNHLFDDMPENELDMLSECTDGLKMMRLALPYYVADHMNVPEIEIDKYDLEAYDLIDKEMENYNITDLVDLLPLENTHTIYCEFDFEKKAGSKKLAEKTVTHDFNGSGHFPFAEQPERYSWLIKGILSIE